MGWTTAGSVFCLASARLVPFGFSAIQTVLFFHFFCEILAHRVFALHSKQLFPESHGRRDGPRCFFSLRLAFAGIFLYCAAADEHRAKRAEKGLDGFDFDQCHSRPDSGISGKSFFLKYS